MSGRGAAVKTLSFKVFDIAGERDLQALGDYFYALTRHPDNLAGKRVGISVKTVGDTRQQKKTALRQLEELIAGSAAGGEKTPAVWEQYGYLFKFAERKYFWNGKEIHVTANEALFLYRWLVLKDATCETQMYHLRNMRRRLGKEFLAEVTE
jgi:hypothetical protein